jgi:uncharacterized coiled-coil DUF342 family protein
MYGDTDVMRARVDQLREQALDLRTTADQLVARAESASWSGRAAEAMRARIRDRAVALRATAERHDTAADALAKHLAEVDRLKDAIGAVERRATVRELPGELPPSGHKDWLELEIA